MNKQLIQNILYAGHCIGICSDWSEKIIDEIIDMLKDKEFVYNESIIDEEKLDEFAERTVLDNHLVPYDDCVEECKDCFKAGYRKALEYE